LWKITNASPKKSFHCHHCKEKAAGTGGLSVGHDRRAPAQEMGFLSAPKPPRHWRGTKTTMSHAPSDPGCSAEVVSRKACAGEKVVVMSL